MKKIVMLLTNAFMPDPRPYMEALSLVKAGYEVKILCWDRGENLPKKEMINDIQIERLYIPSTHGRGTMQILFLSKLWFAMVSHLLRIKVDIIYCHDFDTLPAGLFAKVMFRDKPKVLFDSHDIFSKTLIKNVPQFLLRLISFVERQLIKKANLVVAASPIVAEYYNKLGVMKVFTVENWKKIEDFQINNFVLEDEKKSLGIKNQLVIACVAHLGPENIIKSLLQVVANDPDLFLIIAGDGHQRNLVEDASRQFSNIIYLGYIPYKKVCLVTAMADIIYFAYEKNSPMTLYRNVNKLFEALAAGKAVLGMNFGEMGRIIREEKCGIALDDFDQDSIEKALLRLKDRTKLQSFQANAREAGLKKYNWGNAERKLLDVMTKLMGKDGA